MIKEHQVFQAYFTKLPDWVNTINRNWDVEGLKNENELNFVIQFEG